MKVEKATLEPRVISVAQFCEMTGCFAEDVTSMVRLPIMSEESYLF